MRRRRLCRWYAVCAAIGAIGLAAVAPAWGSSGSSGVPQARAAATRAGFYDGHSGTHWYVELLVNKSDTQVTGIDTRYTHGLCNDGRRFFSGITDKINRPLAHGDSFTYSHMFRHAYELNRRGRKVRGRERFSFTGAFTGGTHFTGVIRDSFRGKHLRCASGKIPVSADLDGTGRAQLENSYAITGLYKGTAEARRATLDLYLPWGLINRFTISSATEDCTPGLTSHGTQKWTVYNVPVRGRSFKSRNTVTIRERGGYVVHHHLRLTGRFNSAFSGTRRVYGAAGEWVDKAQVYRHGKHLGSCTTGQETFSMNGPAKPQAG